MSTIKSRSKVRHSNILSSLAAPQLIVSPSFAALDTSTDPSLEAHPAYFS